MNHSRRKDRRHFCLLMSVLLVFGLLTACGPQGDAVSGPDDQEKDLTAITEDVKVLVKDCFRLDGGYDRIYLAEEGADEAQAGDLRIDDILYAGETDTGDTKGAAFEVQYSLYDGGASDWRQGEEDTYAILGRDGSDAYCEARGIGGIHGEASLEQMILEVSYDLMDLELSLWRDEYDTPVGLGSEITCFAEEEPEKEIMEDWEPVYWPNAYWSEQRWDGFTALCYHVGDEPGNDDPDAYRVFSIDVTRKDVATYRGIRVGSSRDEVKEAYPTIFDTPYWDGLLDRYGEDSLWYCDNEEGWGGSIHFFFEGDTVQRIVMYEMFD